MRLALLAAACCGCASLFAASPAALRRVAKPATPFPRARCPVACAADGVSQPPQWAVDEGLLCRDEESQAWWRATVREKRDNQVLVHFTGCDDAWDTWFDADSPNLMVMDREERSKDRSAFQSDTLGDDLDDEELLAEYQKQRWDQNARWQLNTFAQAQLGQWSGRLELYEPPTDSPSAAAADEEEGDVPAARVLPVQGPWETVCSCDATLIEATQQVQLVDRLPAVASRLGLDLQLGADEFRPERGSMAVASAFSLAVPAGGADGADGGDSWLFELSIREDARRVRCKLLYQPATDAAAASDGQCMRLKQVAVVKEASGGNDFIAGDAESADINGAPGRGLYDPPPGSKLGYCSLYCEGGITLVFPTFVDAGERRRRRRRRHRRRRRRRRRAPSTTRLARALSLPAISLLRPVPCRKHGRPHGSAWCDHSVSRA